MRFLIILSGLVVLIGLIAPIMIVQNVFEHLAMAIGHTIIIQLCVISIIYAKNLKK